MPKVWEQMNLAYQYGADRIWIVNVGDLKPMEVPIEFFLNLAWRSRGVAQGTHCGVHNACGRSANSDRQHAPEIADLVAKYTKYNGRRKPELLEPETFSLVDYHEAERVSDDWQAITRKAEANLRQLAGEWRDAFFQLVLYPVKASAQVTELYITAAKNHLYASQGRASTNDLAARARALFQADADLSGEYNHTLAHGKWNHMMDQPRIGYTGWHDPPANVMPEVKETEVPVAAGLGVAVEGSASAWPGNETEPSLPAMDAFNQQRRYIDIFNRGRTPFAFTASASQPWIMLSATHGTIGGDQRLWVSVDWRKAPKGSDSGTVTVSGAGAGSVAVKVRTFNPERPDKDFSPGLCRGRWLCFDRSRALYAVRRETASARWDEIADYGRTLSSMTIFPMTAPSVTPPDAPCLQYRMYLFNPGTVQVETILAPTLNFVPGRGLRYAIAFDDQPPQIVDALAHNSQADWETSVKDSVRKIQSTHTLAISGYHTLKIWMVDPGVVLQKIVVNTGGLKPSYLGPPESYRSGGSR